MRLLTSGLLAYCVLLAACTAMQPREARDSTGDAAAESVASSLWTQLGPALDDDWHLLLNSGTAALDWRLLAIDSATHSIDLQTFLLTPDAVGAAVLEHLVAAAERGVQVRFLIDDSFLHGQDELIMYIHDHDNIRFRVFNPYQRRSSDAVTRQLLNLADFSRLDHRMHNKAMIVDGRVAIVGGRNLADEYFGLHEGANFRDLEVLLGGRVVADISAAFAEYWNDEWAFPISELVTLEQRHLDRELLVARAQPALQLHSERSATALRDAWARGLEASVRARSTLLVDTPPHGNPADPQEAPVQLANALLELVNAARDEVVLISAYLIPTPALEDSVRRAEERGVDVRVLTNSLSSNNHTIAYSAYRNHIEALLEYGAELYEVRSDALERPLYIRSPVADKSLGLHAKALLLDGDKVFIGSANLDPRSLRINTEMGLLIEGEAFSQSVREALDIDFEAGNAWQVRYDETGRLLWVSGDEVLTLQPAETPLQRLESWFYGLLPVEEEL